MNNNKALLSKMAVIFTIAVFIFNSEVGNPLLVRAASPRIINENFVTLEGYDFATRVLGDPWDMTQFSDLSQWFNHSGKQNYLLNFQVRDGVFSAQTASGLTYFILLFGGYPPGLRTGKIGIVRPISSTQYQCFYMAMKADTNDPDHFQMEFGDENMPQRVAGLVGLPLINHNWKLYKIDLPNMQTVGTSWGNRANWQYMRVTPSLKAGTQFEIDWVRLTNCQEINIRLTNLPNETLNFFVGTGLPERQILIESSFMPFAGNYDVDLQGIAPGNYNYYVKQPNGTVVKQGQITIKPTPIIKFTVPSMTSGEDFAATYATPWDFNDWSDIAEIRCIEAADINNAVFSLDTLPPTQAPGCVGSNVMNPLIFMNTAGSPPLNNYRYVSFHHSIDGAWSVPELGMVVRWVWTVNRGGNVCTYYGKEFALDVGWQDYAVDMYDGWNGVPAAKWPTSCPTVAWKDETGYITELRFEPNENITDYTFHQEIDWVKMTKVPSVQQGQPFILKANLNIPLSDVSSINYYYTDNLSEPLKYPAKAYISAHLEANYRAFLPVIIGQSGEGGTQNYSVSYRWDTSTVPQGNYNICALASDGYNQSIFCSDAPVFVTSQ